MTYNEVHAVKLILKSGNKSYLQGQKGSSDYNTNVRLI